MGPNADWIVLAIFVAGLLWLCRKRIRSLCTGNCPPVSLPQHLNDRVAGRISEAYGRVSQAKEPLAALQTALTAARTAANAANPRIPDLDAAVVRAQENLDRAQDVVQFEESQLDLLLHPDRSHGLLALSRLAAGINWGTVLQYAIFGSLALFVLWHLMKGITSSPPPGTTPRSMITLLIAVVTVGIALILVLSTIVSNGGDSADREKRFSQGKEVLTALLGVLGTIVGFYFGASQDQSNDLVFDTVVVRMEADKPIALSTSVHGGKVPYFFEATFTPASIASVKEKSTDGRIDAPIKGALKPNTPISVVISVIDSEGKTGHTEYRQIVPVNTPK